MNAELLYEALNDQHSLEQLNERELDRLVQSHPYFSIGQLLLAKKLKSENDQDSYQQQRSRVQAFYRNPWWLYYQLELADATRSGFTHYNNHASDYEKGPTLMGTDRWPDVDAVHSPEAAAGDSGLTTGDGTGPVAHFGAQDIAPFESIAHEAGGAGASGVVGASDVSGASGVDGMEAVDVAHETEAVVVAHEAHEMNGHAGQPHLLTMTEDDAPSEYPLYPTNPPKEHIQEAPAQDQVADRPDQVADEQHQVAEQQDQAVNQPFEIHPMPVMITPFLPETDLSATHTAQTVSPEEQLTSAEQAVSPEEQPALPNEAPPAAPSEEPEHAPSETPETAPSEQPSDPGVEVPPLPEHESHEVPDASPDFPKELPPDGPTEMPAGEPAENPAWPTEVPEPAHGPELPSLPAEQPIPAERPIAAEHAANEYPAPPFHFHSIQTGTTFEPFYTVDYFASQGIKLSLEDNATDKLSQHLKSFTEWLRTMKRINNQEHTREELDTASEAEIQQLASSANRQKEAVVTESMAQVWVHQGKIHRAIEVYNKLSLQHPEKRAYFAAKIEQLNR